MENEEKKMANKPVDNSTELGVERTAMAANRTLMAWVRTALSLISFGFTIYKFLQAEEINLKGPMLKQQSPEHVGVFLIAIGTVSMILGSIEYFQTIKRLSKLSTRKFKPFNYSFMVGLAIAFLGFFLFITIVTHTEVF